MVHTGEYSEPVSYTGRSDGNFRFADSELNRYLTDHFKLDCQTSVHLWSVA